MMQRQCDVLNPPIVLWLDKSQRINMIPVRVTYSEDSNVIMAVTRCASQIRGSEFFQDTELFLGYRPMGLSRIQACNRELDKNEYMHRTVNIAKFLVVWKRQFWQM